MSTFFYYYLDFMIIDKDAAKGRKVRTVLRVNEGERSPFISVL